MTKPATRDVRLPLTTSLTFAGASLPAQALSVAIAIHMPAYFAASIGVPLAAVAAAFGTVRLIDVPLEMVLGLGMDRTRTRFGRYRVWMLASVPFLMLGLYYLLNAGPGVGAGYLIAWLLVMYLGSSILGLSHLAWASRLARSYDERARLFGVLAAVGVVGSLSVVAIPAVMAKLGYSDAEGMHAMFWYIILLAPVAIALVTLRTPEPMVEEAHGPQFRLRDYLELVIHHNMSRVLLVDLFMALGVGWFAALYIFFMRDYMLFDTAATSVLLMANIGVGFVGAPGIAWLATRIGKHRAVMVAGAGLSLSVIIMPFLSKGDVAIFLPATLLAGFMSSGCTVMTRAMTADVADEIRLQQGKERSALLYAMTTLVAKVASGLSIFLSFSVLARMGFNAQLGRNNDAHGIAAIALALTGGVVVSIAMGLACLRGYRLTAARAAEVRRILEAQEDAAQGADKGDVV